MIAYKYLYFQFYIPGLCCISGAQKIKYELDRCILQKNLCLEDLHLFIYYLQVTYWIWVCYWICSYIHKRHVINYEWKCKEYTFNNIETYLVLLLAIFTRNFVKLSFNATTLVPAHILFNQNNFIISLRTSDKNLNSFFLQIQNAKLLFLIHIFQNHDGTKPLIFLFFSFVLLEVVLNWR